MGESIRIGNGAGFWGDNLDAPYLLARDGDLDYLTLEYLAELTMSILAHIRANNPKKGFVRDLPDVVGRLADRLRADSRLSVISNGGGLNPRACAVACSRELEHQGLAGLPIGVVWGDDVLPRLESWCLDGLDLSHMETGEPLYCERLSTLVSANVYLGADGIAQAINEGARVVITGRVADVSLTVGPSMARFGWPKDDWDRLAQASVAGHLIECGAQASGGLFEDWASLPDLANIGYPIAEIDEKANVVITKPDGTGGGVTWETVAEQLVYEIDDPSAYETPDVRVDFTKVQLNEVAKDRVSVSGSRGKPPSDRLKLVGTYRDGWTASGMLAVLGRDAEVKARRAGQMVLERVRRAGFEMGDALVECIGGGDIVRGILQPDVPPIEVVLRVTVRDPRREAVERFCREIAPLITSGPSGFAGYASGRPEARPAFGYWPTLVPRSLVQSICKVDTAAAWIANDREGE